ncbi:DNA cytosine methyltransferase [Lachnospiraceae bacterium SGI.085]
MKEAVSLFSSAGIGELGIKKDNIRIVVSSELLPDRHKLYKHNYPDTECITGDIWQTKDEICEEYLKRSMEKELFLVYATPPCQGMSSNGAGTLLKGIREGKKPKVDERNRLIIPTMDIVSKLRPRWLLMENVPNMRNTIIDDENGEFVNIIEYVKRRLGSEYLGAAMVVSCSDYGIPQTRKRLITVFTRDSMGKEYISQWGHLLIEKDKKPPKTLRQAIGSFPALDSVEGKNSNTSFNQYHFVPVMNPEKYWWIANTPEGNTAYNNQCVNPKCMYQYNGMHIDKQTDGIWHSNSETPIYCEKCGELLPRPSIIDKKTGERRLLKGFHSAYRRMKWDEPAATITQNFIYEASDNKVHPSQNRVLSIYEGMVIQTVSEYEYDFTIDDKMITNGMFAQILGESVPPKLIEIIVSKMINIEKHLNCDFMRNDDE